VIENVAIWAKKMLYKTADSPDYAATSGIKRDIFKKIIRQDLSEQLPKITTATLIVWGTLDSYLPVKDAYRAQKLIAHSKLEIIPGGTHGLHLHQKQKLLELITKFVYD
jgi:pimeloyl-ACP methyl ester carboxylesterase